MYLFLMFLQVREVQLPHQEFGELLCFLVSALLLQQQNRSDQTEKDTAAHIEMLVFSPSLLLHFALHSNISGLEIGTVAQSPYFVINRGMIFHGCTAVV